MSDIAGKVWTSELNSRPGVSPAFDRSRTIRFYDTTLRDGEQTVGVISARSRSWRLRRGWMNWASGASKPAFQRCRRKMAKLSR